jgi:hypothetical protein
LLQGDFATGTGLIAIFLVAIFGPSAIGAAILWFVLFPFVALSRSTLDDLRRTSRRFVDRALFS